jgi:hypothetical protein
MSDLRKLVYLTIGLTCLFVASVTALDALPPHDSIHPTPFGVMWFSFMMIGLFGGVATAIGCVALWLEDKE